MSPLELAEKIVRLKPVDKGPDTRWEIWLTSASGSLVRYLSETDDHRAAQNLRKGYVDDVAMLLEWGARLYRDNEMEISTN